MFVVELDMTVTTPGRQELAMNMLYGVVNILCC
jgi:hypothetical protein